MKAFTLYNRATFGILCLFLGIGNIILASPNNNFPLNTIDCSSFDQIEYYDCVDDFPDILPDFRDFTTSGNGDLFSYASIGGITVNCSNLIITAQDLVFPPNDCTDSLRIQRVYTFSDGVSIVGECTRTFVTFELPISITSPAQNLIVSCEENVDSLFNDWLANLGGTELFQCMDPATVTRLPANPVIFFGDCRQVDTLSNIISGDIRVQWTFEDDCGIRVSTIAGFFVIDTIAPTVLCPQDMTFDIGDENLLNTIENTLNQVRADEDCDEFRIDNNFSSNNIVYNCDPEQTIPVLFTAIDSCQNMSTCTSTLTLLNNSQPEIICPPNITLECGDINNFDLVTAWINTASGEDNVGNNLNVNTDFDISVLNSSFCNQETDITFEVTDNCGRSTTCVSRIILDDNTPPTVNCPPSFFSTYSSPTLIQDRMLWLSSFTGSDLCNSFQTTRILSNPDLDFDCEDKDVLVTYTATDECGNSASCESNISITNDYDSNIMCVGPLTLYCGETDNALLLDDWLNAVQANDNLGSTLNVTHDLDVTADSTLECHGLFQVNFTMIDLCGDTNFCNQVFEVLDTIVPTITCPVDFTIQSTPATLDQEIQDWLDSYTASDNCTNIEVISNFDNSLFEGCDLSINNDITFTVSDNCGLQNTCISNLTIETDRFPTVICPFPLVIECGNTTNATAIENWLLTSTGSDFTGGDLSVVNDYLPSNINFMQCSDSLEITFSIIDDCNWTDTCRTAIRLEDTTPPELTCPIDLNINTTISDINTVVVNWLNDYTTSDNCISSLVSQDFDITTIDFCNANDEYIVTFTAEDACSLTSTCQSTLMFNNNPPSIDCPQNLILECGDSNNESLIENWLDDARGSNNNGTNIAVVNDFDISILDISCSENYTVNFISEDNCLRTSSCTSQIIINDTTAPEIDCPMDLNLLSGDPNKESKYNDYINNINIMDCNTYTISSDFDVSLLAFSCDDQLILPFTFVATDDCGTSSSCALTIEISNNVVANIDCPNNLVLNCGDTINQDTIVQWLQETTAADNVGNSFPVDNDFDASNPLLINCQSTIPVVFEMVDLCNSAITCTSSIVIEDNEAPTINCPVDTFFIFENADFSTNVETWINTAIGSDNCTATTIDDNYDSSTVLGNCEEEATQTITFTIEDACGFTNDCTADLTVRTSRTPIITCPSELIVECGIDNTANIFNWIALSSGEDADGLQLNVMDDYSQSAFDLLTCGDTLTVNFNIADNCNFMADCSTLIILEDTTPPSVNCDASITINSADPDANSNIESWLNGFTSTDNCGSATGQNDFDLSVFEICSAASSIEVIYTATDDCGLMNSCQSTIEINSNAPQINCPSDLTLECGLSTNDIASEVARLISDVQTTDNAGNTISNITNDYVDMSLVNDCQSSVNINIITTDNCNRTNTCSVNVSIEDTTAPDIICPSNIQIDIEDTNIQSQIDIWLASYDIVEACNTANTVDDFNIDISTLDCGTFTDVEFVSTDACNNSSSCFANLTFVNNNDITISCPDDISVSCSTFNESDLTDFLNGYAVESQDTFTFSNDYESLALSCFEIEIQSVTFSALDICGNFTDCTSTISYIPAASTYIPNTFTPNRDGDNDVFTVFSNEYILNVSSLAIYDRWGELIFLNENFPPNDESQGWDGRFDNGDAVQGVYIYVVKTEDDNGNFREEVGQLNLIR